MGKSKVSGLLLGFLLICVAWFGMEEKVHAQTYEVNAQTGYQVIIEDDADLISSAEEEKLAELMEDITAYGNVAFKTIDYNFTSTERYIKEYYYDTFKEESGTVFLIDMDNREIYIYSDGDIYRVITKGYANSITDNVYTYASDGDYYACAYKAFSQILTLLGGNKIAQPMKYISNGFLAVIFALMINYFVVMLMSRAKEPNEKELLAATKHQCNLSDEQVVFTHQTKKYSPPSSSSGGGGGGGGGGSHGGGGGGHSF